VIILIKSKLQKKSNTPAFERAPTTFSAKNLSIKTNYIRYSPAFSPFPKKKKKRNAHFFFLFN
jgi:hypothetical protein